MALSPEPDGHPVVWIIAVDGLGEGITGTNSNIIYGKNNVNLLQSSHVRGAIGANLFNERPSHKEQGSSL